MKILIVNEFLIFGGAEQSCLKMKKILEKDNEVIYLNFDKDYEEKIKEVNNCNNIINIKLGSIKIKKGIYNIFVCKKIRNKIKEINPDKIILNNLFSSPITQLKAMKGYEVYQIIRDYYAVCPKSTCIRNDYSICDGYKFSNCCKECNKSLKMILKLHLIRKLERIRKKIVKQVISPSEKLNEYLKKFGYNSICINNPMEIAKESIENKIKCPDQLKKYIYLGNISEIKGIYKFIEVFNQFSQNKNVELKIVGRCAGAEDEKRIEELVEKNPKIKYIGYKPHKEIIEILKESNFIVVPSLWIENYPTTALQGMLYKCLVLGSNRGGIPEIIGDNRGILFDILNAEDILDKLEKSFNMTKEEYSTIINRAFEYVIDNNSFDKYYERIMKAIR